MFNTLEDTLVLSEPHTLYHAHTMFNLGEITRDQLGSIVESSMVLQCKQLNARPVRRVVVKPNLFCTPLFGIVKEKFPNAR